ncbi:hypothetical protein F4780DRAFT_733162 [Xylariomycetidae sp. FL0641]|nr:hypothetical protein F4780DRAFT_733162 [Xylariomycetidae sp. FL0641]
MHDWADEGQMQMRRSPATLVLGFLRFGSAQMPVGDACQCGVVLCCLVEGDAIHFCFASHLISGSRNLETTNSRLHADDDNSFKHSDGIE